MRDLVTILTEADLRGLVPLDLAAIDCVEDAFRALATKPVAMPPILRLDIPEHRGEVDVKTAYEVVHKDELLTGAIRYAVQSAQKKTVDNIRARGMRPPENGASGNGSATVVKSNPNNWTKEDFNEVIRRVQHGEKIRL